MCIIHDSILVEFVNKQKQCNDDYKSTLVVCFCDYGSAVWPVKGDFAYII